jgi:antitoxin component of MazEF toxin-antitoxin module
MRGKLQTIGSETGLILDRSLLERVNLEADAEVEIEASDDTLIVRAVRDARHNPLEEAFRHMMEDMPSGPKAAPGGDPDEPSVYQG